MKNLFALLFLPVLLTAVEPGFYVWQRQNSPALKQAVTEFRHRCSGELYFLAGELENDNSVIAVPPADFVDFAGSTPVIRVHIAHLDKTPDRLAGEIKNLYLPWQKCRKLQIDLDCPESKIARYPALIKALRKILPETELSATVLPCHLLHKKEFSELSAVCDYFVLQIHGLHQNGNNWLIMDKKIALNAWNQAKKFKRPFKTAIPLYSAMVNGKTVTPDLHFTANLAKIARNHGGVIGFRLGIAGDMDTLDQSAALAISRGEKYSPKIFSRWQEQPNGAHHLFIRTTGLFAQKVAIKLAIPEKIIEITDFDTFNGAQFDANSQVLTLTLPPCGEEKTYLWLRVKDNPLLNKFIYIKEFKIL